LEPYAEERFFNKNVQIVMFEEESQEPYIIALGGGKPLPLWIKAENRHI